MGMANAHILLGINPELTIKDFFDGSCSIEKVITVGPEKLDVYVWRFRFN